jgi:dTDP-4-amino-4,6-dideoxygalactose transaminase
MNIPFVDLKAQYLSIKTDIDKAINNILENANFVGGQPVKDFEQAFSAFMGVKYCIACGNGTDSIEILLQAMGIGKGDEVIVPAISWISTAEAVSYIGATPIFVDIDEYFTIDVTKIEEKITKNTKAIIPVHLYGHPADMPKIMEIAKKYKLKVLEDCAQAHNAKIFEQKVGTFGDCASFSFYPGKNLGAYGDAGAMTTNDLQIAEKARRIANHGQLKKHDHVIEGRNSRMDTLQAAILNVKLPHLDNWTEKRQENAFYYNHLLKENTNIIIPKIRENSSHVFHLYVIRTKNRVVLQEKLNQNGIQTAIHYPTALPFLECYQNRNFTEKDFPVAFQFQQEILSLPMFAELKEKDIEYICQFI